MFSIYRSYWELKRKLTRFASEGNGHMPYLLIERLLSVIFLNDRREWSLLS